MHLRNLADKRAFYRRLLLGLLGGLMTFLVFRGTFLPGASKSDTIILTKMRLPLAELSGLTKIESSGDRLKFAAVGDEKAEILYFTLSNDLQSLSVLGSSDFGDALENKLQICATSHSLPCRSLKKRITSDWEAVAQGPDGTIHVVQEFSSSIVSFQIDNPTDVIVSNLRMPPDKDGNVLKSVLHQSSKNEVNLFEGLAWVGQDSVYLVKENDPPALILFSSRKNSDSTTAALEPKAIWRWRDRGCDISDLQIDDDGQIYLLSHTCKKISLIEQPDTNKRHMRTAKSWELPKTIKNPEAFIILGRSHFLVGSDQKKSKKPNLYLIKAVNR